jgi:hypothetical protein
LAAGAPLPDEGRLADARLVEARFVVEAPFLAAPPFAAPLADADFFAPPFAAAFLPAPERGEVERAPVVPADDPRAEARVVLPLEDFVPSAMTSSL